MCHTQRSAHNAKQTNTVVILVSAVLDYRYKYNYTMICYRKMNTNTNTYKMSHTQQCVHDAKQSNTVVILVSSSHAAKKQRNPYRGLHLSKMWQLNFSIVSLPYDPDFLFFSPTKSGRPLDWAQFYVHLNLNLNIKPESISILGEDTFTKI